MILLKFGLVFILSLLCWVIYNLSWVNLMLLWRCHFGHLYAHAQCILLDIDATLYLGMHWHRCVIVPEMLLVGWSSIMSLSIMGYSKMRDSIIWLVIVYVNHNSHTHTPPTCPHAHRHLLIRFLEMEEPKMDLFFNGDNIDYFHPSFNLHYIASISFVCTNY